jgi:hypothetical protein
LTSLYAATCAIPSAESYIDNCPLDFGSVCSPEDWDWDSDALAENNDEQFDAEGTAGGIDLQAGSSLLVIKPYLLSSPSVGDYL